MKKKSTLLMISVILAQIICSCGDNTKADVQNTADNTISSEKSVTTTVPDRIDELGEHNFNGRSFTLLDANDYPTALNIPGDATNGDIINDALYNRGLWIEERYGIDLIYVQESPAKNGTQKLKNAVLSDENAYDLCLSTILGGTLGTISGEGVLQNLLEIPHLSLNEKWWSSLLYDSLQIGGKMYYTSGDISPILYVSPAALLINTDLLEDRQLDYDIGKLVKDGKWTVDCIAQIVKGADSDIDGDGVMNTDSDFFGYLHQTAVLSSNAMLVGAGLSLCDNTSDGISVNLNQEKTFNVIEKLRKLTVTFTCESQNDVVNKAFRENRAMIVQHFVGAAQLTQIREMDADIILAPMPKYDETQNHYYSLLNAWNACFIGIPANADLEYVGLITEALAYYSYKNIRPSCYELFLKVKIARNEETTEMIDIIYNSAYIDFNALYDFGGIMTKLSGALFRGDELASSLASHQSKIEADVKKLQQSWCE